jgi:hypothetical protein
MHTPCAPHKLYLFLDCIPFTHANTTAAHLLTSLWQTDPPRLPLIPSSPRVHRFSILESSSSRGKTLGSLQPGCIKTEDNEKGASFIKTTFSNKTALAIYDCNKSWTSNFSAYFIQDENRVTEFNVTLDQDLFIRFLIEQVCVAGKCFKYGFDNINVN